MQFLSHHPFHIFLNKVLNVLDLWPIMKQPKGATMDLLIIFIHFKRSKLLNTRVKEQRKRKGVKYLYILK